MRNDALRCDRWNRLHPTKKPRVPYLKKTLVKVDGPIVAASDFMQLVPDQIAPWVDQTFVTLGTDGFGMSDTREALRRYFDVDGESIALGALEALRRDGKIDAKTMAEAIDTLGIDPEKLEPLDI